MAEKTEGVEPRELIEKAAEAGKEYAATVNAAAIAGLASAFELQNTTMAAWTKAVRDGQAQATKLAAASVQLAERTFDSK